MSTALRIRFRLSLSLTFASAHFIWFFIFWLQLYLFLGFPSLSLISARCHCIFYPFFSDLFFGLLLFFGNPALSISLPHRYPAPRFCVSDAYAGTGSGYLEIRGAGWPGESGLLMRALMEYAHTHPADPRTRTHA